MTHVSPQLQINHNGDYASGVLIARGFNETYANNSGLNFFGGGGSLMLSLDNSIKRLLPNASLSISDSVTYTPLPPGFVNPVAGTSPGDPGNAQNTFARGLLAFRTNNVINNGTVSTSYATTASTSVDASYSHAILRFGSSPLTAGLGQFGGLFNVTTQTGTVGGSAKLTELDKMTAKYSYAHSDFTSVTAGSVGTEFQTQMATIGWSRPLTSALRLELGGGGILVKPADSPGKITYAANAALIGVFPMTYVTLSFSRTAFPSIQAGGTVLTGETVAMSVVHKINQQWHVAQSASYVHSTGDFLADKLSNNYYMGSIDLHYWITQVWSSALSYDYLRYSSDFGGANFQADRHAISLSLTARFD